MTKLNRRTFLASASALALNSSTCLRALTPPASGLSRVYAGSNTHQGILAFDWNAEKGELTPAGIAAAIDNVDWILYSPDRKFLFACSEVDSFNGHPTGGITSFRVTPGGLEELSRQNSAGRGTCHIALDPTGQCLLAADYWGGSCASFKITDGQLSPLVSSEHYSHRGPNPTRQEQPHAHFASFSPDGRFAYINDLGGDLIHIYRLDAATATLTPAGNFVSTPGNGPRTLRFHPNGHTAFAMNEMTSSVDILEWSQTDGSLRLTGHHELHPAPYSEGQGNTGCDTVISRNGEHVYLANRGDDFIEHCLCNPTTGALTPQGRYKTGGTTPRSFTLSPDERFLLVANQNSGAISTFARDPHAGTLAHAGRTTPADSPMCILFA